MIEIYGKPSCPSCSKAKSFCESNGFKYKYYTLDEDFTKDELFEQFPTARTFPQIKIGENKVGGYEQMLTYIESTGYNGTGFAL